MNTQRGSLSMKIAAGVAIMFGALTILSGGQALFGSIEARAALGNVVLFVLWFNFVAGFAYVAAGIGLALGRSWAFLLSIAILATTTLVLVAFGLHVLGGGVYEMRTVGAMILRVGIWAAIVALAASKVSRPLQRAR